MIITTYRPLTYMMRWPNGHYNISASNLHDEVAKWSLQHIGL